MFGRNEQRTVRREVPKLTLQDRIEYVSDDAIAARRLELKRAGRCLAKTRRNGASNHRASAVQPRLHGLLAQPQAFSRLGRAEALDITEHEDRAIRVRQTIDGFFEDPLKLTRVGEMLGRGLR